MKLKLNTELKNVVSNLTRRGSWVRPLLMLLVGSVINVLLPFLVGVPMVSLEFFSTGMLILSPVVYSEDSVPSSPVLVQFGGFIHTVRVVFQDHC